MSNDNEVVVKWKYINPIKLGFGERPFVPRPTKEQIESGWCWTIKSIEKSKRILEQQRLREEAESNDE